MEGSVAPSNEIRLTPREIEVIGYVALGLNVRELGARLDISPRTVQKHIEHINLKLKAKNKTHMVALALALGIIPPISTDPSSDMPEGSSED